MDGRVQLPVNQYVQKRFQAEFVDTITEAGPNLILAENYDQKKVQSILDRLKISVEKHHSVGIAIVGHHDCAGNPVHKARQVEHTKNAIKTIEQTYAKIEIIGLWVGDDWEVEELR